MPSSAAAANGRRIVKHVPSPTTLLTAMVPPCSSMMRWAIESPRPVPSSRLVGLGAGSGSGYVDLEPNGDSPVDREVIEGAGAIGEPAPESGSEPVAERVAERTTEPEAEAVVERGGDAAAGDATTADGAARDAGGDVARGAGGGCAATGAGRPSPLPPLLPVVAGIAALTLLRARGARRGSRRRAGAPRSPGDSIRRGRRPMRHTTIGAAAVALGLCVLVLGSLAACDSEAGTDPSLDTSVDTSGTDGSPGDAAVQGPSAGDPCQTRGADDFRPTCDGDALLYCVCTEWEGDDCPARSGTWVQQDILCTCAEHMAGRCPVE